MKKSEISLAIMVLKYGLDYLQYLWDPLIAFFMAEFPSQAHFLGLTHVSGQKRAPGHGTPFCALVRAGGETSACEGRPCGGGRVPGEWPPAGGGRKGRGGETYSEEDGYAIN